MKPGLDPLLSAQISAALWCKEVKMAADAVAERRNGLHFAMAHLEVIAARADRALSDVQAIKTIRSSKP